MTDLIIHPRDSTTDFLRPIYEGGDAPVIRGGCAPEAVRHEIEKADRVVMMGHGTPFGLMAVGQFPGTAGFVVDDVTAALLDDKDENVFVWCHASDYVEENALRGFTTGMFISELSEARMCGVPMATQDMIDLSNELFTEVLRANIDQSGGGILVAMEREYGQLAKTNPVAAYNMERMMVGDGTKRENQNRYGSRMAGAGKGYHRTRDWHTPKVSGVPARRTVNVLGGPRESLQSIADRNASVLRHRQGHLEWDDYEYVDLDDELAAELKELM